MNSLKQNQKKPFIDDESLRRKQFQVVFSTVSEEVRTFSGTIRLLCQIYRFHPQREGILKVRKLGITGWN
jgi:hypothetical protein